MLVGDIIKKKELKDLNKEFVSNELREYLKRNKIEEIPNEKSAKYKKIVKDIRKKFREIYGVYKTRYSGDVAEFISSMRDFKSFKENSNEILKAHTSTLERRPYYEEIYSKLFDGETSIIDLGCGLNPFSIPCMPRIKKYFAADFNISEIHLLNDYFKIASKYYPGFEGFAEVIDLRKLEFKLPHMEMCFLFKILDVIEKKGHKHAEKLIEKIPANKIIVSFPTKTLSQKKMNYPRRKWIELMAQRLGYKMESFEAKNEIFYTLKKPEF